MKSQKINIIFLLILSIVKFYFQEITAHREIQINKNYDFIMQSQQRIQYFQFSIKEKVTDDFAILVRALDYISDPDIYISFEKQFPNEENFQIKCNQVGDEVCIIPLEKIQQHRLIYFSVSCRDSCTYTILIEQTIKNQVQFNVETQLIFKKDKNEMFFTVEIRELSQQTAGILFRASLSDIYDSKATNIQMFINQGAKTPSTDISSNDILSTLAWENSRIASVKLGNQFYCDRCIFTILVKVNKPCVVQFIARAFQAVQNIQINSKQNDISFPNMFNKYKLIISEDQLKSLNNNNFITFNLIIYVGNAQLFITCDNKNLENPLLYQWQSTTLSSNQLTISYKDVQDECKNFEEFNVAVLSKIFSAYTLNVEILNMNQKYLRVGIPEYGNIQKKQIFTYLFNNFINDEDFYISFTLTPDSGNPDLYVKRCAKTQNQCIFSQDDIDYVYAHNEQDTEINQIWIKFSNNTEGLDVIRFKHEAAENQYYYIVAVVGQSDINKYNLLVDIDNQIIQLREGQPFINQINMGTYSDFVFRLYQDQDITSINIQLTPITGQPVVLASRRVSRLRDQGKNYDLKSSQDTNIISYNFTNNPLPNFAGQYHFSVTSSTDVSMYSLLISVLRSNQQNYIRLNPNIPQKYVFTDKHNAALFFLSIDTGKSIPPVTINLNAIRGKFKYQIQKVSNNQQDNSYSIESKESRVQILPDDKIYQGTKDSKSLDLKITVESLQTDPINNQFILWFSTDDFTLLIQPGVTQKYVLQAKQEIHFKLLINREPKDLFIKGESVENKVQIYLSVDSKQTMPHDSQTSFKSNEKGEILLNYQEIIKDHCRYFQNDKQKTPCVFYLNAINPTSDTLEFSLSFTRGRNIYLLEEDIFETFSLPLSGDSIYFQIKPRDTSEQLNILVSTQDGQIGLGYKILNGNIDDINKNLNIEVSCLTSEYYERLNYNNKLTIPSSELQIYGYYTIILIKIQVQKNLWDNMLSIIDPDILPYFGELSIQANTGITNLKEGYSLQDKIGQSGHNFYQFNVLQLDCEIILMLSKYSNCDLEMEVNYGLGIPNQRNGKWSLQTEANSMIKIVKDGLTNQDMNGTYSISVFGKEKCTYSITAVARKNKIIQVDPGLPLNIQFSKDMSLYFVYKHKKPQAHFQFLTNIKLGSTDIKVCSLPSNNFAILTDEYLHNYKVLKHQISNSSSNIIQIFPNQQFSEQRFNSYLFEVRASETAQLDLLISVDQESSMLQHGNSLFDHISGKSSKLYIFKLTDKINYLITLEQYQGEVDVYGSSKHDLNKDNSEFKSSSDVQTQRIDYDGQISKNKKLLRINANEITNYKFNSDFYVLVESSSQNGATYLLSLKSEDTKINLYDGRFEYGLLKPNQKQELFFQAYVTEFREEQEITITLYSYSPQSNKVVQNPYFIIQYKYGESWQSLPFEKLVSSNEYEGLIVKKILPMQVQYKFIIQNQDSVEITYQIVVNIRGIITLPLNLRFYDEINLGKQRLFEVVPQSVGNLYLEVYDCVGQVNIKAFSELAKIKIESDIKLDNDLTSSGYYKINIIKQQVFYILLDCPKDQNISQEFQNKIYFKIKLFMGINDNLIPHLQVKPGNQGKINVDSVSINSQQKIAMLSWELPVISNALKNEVNVNDIYFVYRIIISDQEHKGQMAIKCPDVANKFLKLGNISKAIVPWIDYQQQGSLYHYQFKIEDGKDYFVSLSIDVKSDGNTIGNYEGAYSVFYEKLKFNSKDSDLFSKQLENKSEDTYIVSGVLLVFVFVLGSGLLIFYIKWKQAKMRLQFELNQIRIPSINSDYTPPQYIESNYFGRHHQEEEKI